VSRISGVTSTAVARDSVESRDWRRAAARRLTARAKSSATACRRSSLSIPVCSRRGVSVFSKLSARTHMRPEREVSGFLGILSDDGLTAGKPAPRSTCVCKSNGDCPEITEVSDVCVRAVGWKSARRS
jgi:hypothetical protein